MSNIRDHQKKWSTHFDNGGKAIARTPIVATHARSIRPKKRKLPAVTLQDSASQTADVAVKLASLLSGNSVTSGSASNDSRLMIIKLESDLNRISLQASRQRKHEIQREILPSYDDYLAKTMLSPAGDDPVLVQCMIWRFNLGEVNDAMTLADHAIEHGFSMPETFKCNLQQFVCREVAEWALDKQTSGESPQPHLNQIYDASRDWDKPDQIEARLLKAMGNEQVEIDPAKALEFFEKAAPLDDRIGVAQIIKRLNKQLANSEAAETLPDSTKTLPESQQQ